MMMMRGKHSSICLCLYMQMRKGCLFFIYMQVRQVNTVTREQIKSLNNLNSQRKPKTTLCTSLGVKFFRNVLLTFRCDFVLHLGIFFQQLQQCGAKHFEKYTALHWLQLKIKIIKDILLASLKNEIFSMYSFCFDFFDWYYYFFIEQ